MNVRDAKSEDAPEISALLQALTAAGKRTRPSDEAFVRSFYIGNPNEICCHVAEDDEGTILGFQVLHKAMEGNEWGVTPGWGTIGTHIHPNAARRGVGRALFTATRDVAARAGLRDIDASIGETNEEGLMYYEAMGFRTYRTPTGKVCKRLSIGEA